MKMKKCTLIKVLQNGKMIDSYIYNTDSHALALHQFREDYSLYSRSDIVCCAETIDIDIKDCTKHIKEVFGWD